MQATVHSGLKLYFPIVASPVLTLGEVDLVNAEVARTETRMASTVDGGGPQLAFSLNFLPFFSAENT